MSINDIRSMPDLLSALQDAALSGQWRMTPDEVQAVALYLRDVYLNPTWAWLEHCKDSPAHGIVRRLELIEDNFCLTCGEKQGVCKHPRLHATPEERLDHE